MGTAVISRRRWRWWSAFAFIVLAGLAALDAWRLHRIEDWNARIAAMEAPGVARIAAALAPQAPAEARFAAARAISQQGETTRAVALYREVAQARRDLAAAALFDAANALMREADRTIVRGEWVGARPLLELAKETYRESLRLDAARWDARYNLERALRLAPEDQPAQSEPLPMGGESERSVTTMRAFTLGLP